MNVLCKQEQSLDWKADASRRARRPEAAALLRGVASLLMCRAAAELQASGDAGSILFCLLSKARVNAVLQRLADLFWTAGW